MSLVTKLYDHEAGLVAAFHQHPFFRLFSEQSDTDIRRYLTERYVVSENFVRWYDRAINGLTDPEARSLLRKITLDETPQNAPSHREDLISDLQYIGVPIEKILSRRASKSTLKVINRLNELVAYSSDSDYDLRVMAALRMAGEILVAEEYRHVVPELEKRFGLTPERSRFYFPHFQHDQVGGSSGGIDSHTDSFHPILERLITNEEKLGVAIDASDRAYKVRISLFDQFAQGDTRKQIAKVILAIAASVLVALPAIKPLTEKIHHVDYALFLASLAPEEKVFYHDTDQWLFNRFRETGDARYLKNVGTFEAVNDVWGPGP